MTIDKIFNCYYRITISIASVASKPATRRHLTAYEGKPDGILVCIVCNFSSVIDFMLHIRLATH